MADSTQKPPKPYPDFPLYAHASKRWAKKIKGKTHFFGPWRDWQAAYTQYQEQVHDLQMGRKPRPKVDGAITVADLCNKFLAAKESLVKSGELKQRTWLDYRDVSRVIVDQLGRNTDILQLTPEDFAELRTRFAAGKSLATLKSAITRSLVIFNYAHKSQTVPHPLRVGEAMKKPARANMKREKLAKDNKSFTVDELHALYTAAKPQMRCFMLLALNGGLGNGDLGQLEPKHIQGEWLDYPRPKTATERRFPLWPETKAAIDATGDMGRKYVFATKYGAQWYRGDESTDQPLSSEFTKLCKAAGCYIKGRGFYALRHQFRSIARGCRDREAVDSIMGHVDSSTASHYMEWGIEDERLQAVVNHVREWVKPMWEVGQ